MWQVLTVVPNDTVFTLFRGCELWPPKSGPANMGFQIISNPNERKGIADRQLWDELPRNVV